MFVLVLQIWFRVHFITNAQVCVLSYRTVRAGYSELLSLSRSEQSHVPGFKTLILVIFVLKVISIDVFTNHI